MYETKVLIVGAGPTGLTLAIDLARRAISFRLIRAPKRSLRERLRVFGREVEFGKALTTFTQNTHGVEATTSNGEIIQADFMVGADGGLSAVRKTLWSSTRG